MKERTTNEETSERTQQHTNERTNEQTNDWTNEQTNKWTNEYPKCSTYFSRSPILWSFTSQSSDNCWTFHFCSLSSSCSLFTSLSLLLRSVCCFLMSFSSLETSSLLLLSSDDTWSSLLLLWKLKITQEIVHWLVWRLIINLKSLFAPLYSTCSVNLHTWFIRSSSRLTVSWELASLTVLSCNDVFSDEIWFSRLAMSSYGGNQ